MLPLSRQVPQRLIEDLITKGPSPVHSCLVEGKKGMKRAMLEVVVSGAVAEPADVDRYIRCTLLAAMNDHKTVSETTINALKWLGAPDAAEQAAAQAKQLAQQQAAEVAGGAQAAAAQGGKQAAQRGLSTSALVCWDRAAECYQPTALGRAVLGSGLPPELCLTIKVGGRAGRRGGALGLPSARRCASFMQPIAHHLCTSRRRSRRTLAPPLPPPLPCRRTWSALGRALCLPPSCTSPTCASL